MRHFIIILLLLPALAMDAQTNIPTGTEQAWQHFVRLLQQPNSVDSVADHFIYPIHCAAWHYQLPGNQHRQLTDVTWAGFYPITRAEFIQHYDQLLDAHTREQITIMPWPPPHPTDNQDEWEHVVHWQHARAHYAALGTPIYGLTVPAMSNLLVLFFKQGDTITLRIIVAPVYDNRDD